MPIMLEQAVCFGRYSTHEQAGDGPLRDSNGTYTSWSEAALFTGFGLVEGLDVCDKMTLVELLPVVLRASKVSTCRVLFYICM